jgi:hypothetical protein
MNGGEWFLGLPENVQGLVAEVFNDLPPTDSLVSSRFAGWSTQSMSRNSRILPVADVIRFP